MFFCFLSGVNAILEMGVLTSSWTKCFLFFFVVLEKNSLTKCVRNSLISQ